MDVEKEVKKLINESVKLNFAGVQFVMSLDTNEDPNKKGIKIQFVPTQYGKMTPAQFDDISEELKRRINKGLLAQGFDMTLERDRQVKDKTVISLFLYVDNFDRIIRRALVGDEGSPKQKQNVPDEETNKGTGNTKNQGQQIHGGT